MIGGPQFLSHMAWISHPDRLGEERDQAEALDATLTRLEEQYPPFQGS